MLLIRSVKRIVLCKATLQRRAKRGPAGENQYPALSITNCLPQLPGCGCGANEAADNGALMVAALSEICISVR